MIQAPSLHRPAGPVATKTSLLQRLGAAGYDWLFDRVDPLGGADHRRRLVEQATGEVLEIGAGTGRNLPLYRTATRVVALEPGWWRWSPARGCAPGPTRPPGRPRWPSRSSTVGPRSFPSPTPAWWRLPTLPRPGARAGQRRPLPRAYGSRGSR
jgi:hypothetical protein